MEEIEIDIFIEDETEDTSTRNSVNTPFEKPSYENFVSLKDTRDDYSKNVLDEEDAQREKDNKPSVFKKPKIDGYVDLNASRDKNKI